MNFYAIILIAIAVAGVFFAGCMQFSGNGPATTAVPVTGTPVTEPAVIVPVTEATDIPQQVVTIIHQVSRVRDIKDSELLFALQVPVEWDVKTYRLNNPDNSEGLVYRTDLVGDDMFFVVTYAISRSQDQAYRDQFRKWSPAPVETTVTMNQITYDRFESTSDGRTRVAYVARKSSANERGYASMISFVADSGDRFQKEDFEKVVSTFAYFPADATGTMPGEEIPRTTLPVALSGTAQSARAGSDPGSAGGSSAGGCSRCRGS